jgi:O-antigen ligase
MALVAFLRYRFDVGDPFFTLFFKGFFLSTLIAYLPSLFPFFPASLFGFNWSGIAWIFCFLWTLGMFILSPKKSYFYLQPWLLWVFYCILYLIYDFSLIGLQLTMQYLLPVFLGIVIGSHNYTTLKLLWLLQFFFKTILTVYILFVLYHLIKGVSPHMASTPMFFLVGATLSLSFYFRTQRIIFFIIYAVLFIMPLVSLTRMAILVFVLTYVIHFANTNIVGKIIASGLGGITLLLVIYSDGFQEKTFRSGEGNLSELSLNYYEADSNFNDNGRSSWETALSPGLAKSPIFGNGPRADALVLGSVLDRDSGEAHNDYLSILYNYGLVGLSLFLFGFARTFLKLLAMYRKCGNEKLKILLSTTLTLFVGFFCFMYSDNIAKYTIWFPNYFFGLMGITFSMYHTEGKNTLSQSMKSA